MQESASPIPTEVSRRALELAQALAKGMASPREHGLQGQLGEVSALLTNLPHISSALVIALDEEGTPLTSGTCRLSLPPGRSQLEVLFELHQQLAPKIKEGTWIPFTSSILESAQSEEAFSEAAFWALAVQGTSRLLGLLVVAVDTPASASQVSLESIVHCRDIVAAAIRSSLQTEAWSRIEKLQQLSVRTFAQRYGQPDRDFSQLVQKLAALFEADAVTMLLKEQDELRLTASTDSKLGSDRPVVYLLGQGLTGHVFNTGEPLRLKDTGNSDEIVRAIGKERERASHPERDQQGQFTGQFLGVAMRFGGQVIGVLRMSRRRGVARFSREDERALQFFADLLGAALAPAWDLLLKRSVLESMTELIAISRREETAGGQQVSRIVMANPGAERLLDWSQEELKNLEAKEIYDSEEYEKIRQILKPILSVARQEGYGTYGPIKTKLKKRNGAQVPVMISYRFITNRLVSPPALYTIGLARDISESEQQAEQYRRLLELLGAMKIAYFSADQGGFTQVSTPIDSDLTGFSQEELKSMPRATLFHEPRERALLLKRAREHAGQLLRDLVRMRRKDGTAFWAEGDLRILRDSQGHEIGSEGLYRDVTDRIGLQGFLNADTERVLSDDELFAKLKQDAEFHIDYMSSLGHQLQTPLGSLVETLRNLEAGVETAKAIESRLPYVIGQAIVCTRLVRNLSYMDKILRNEPFQRERVSLARLSIQTKLDFIHLLKEKHLELHVDDESLDRLLQVNGHKEMLRQVIVNLVDNAIKYSIPGTHIEIRGRQWPAGPAFEITNQGLPIPESERDKVFQRGFRTRKAQAVVPHGTGLGLWLVRKIVEAHGATIRCQEVLEAGQKRILFRILFPWKASSRRLKIGRRRVP